MFVWLFTAVYFIGDFSLLLHYTTYTTPWGYGYPPCATQEEMWHPLLTYFYWTQILSLTFYFNWSNLYFEMKRQKHFSFNCCSVVIFHTVYFSIIIYLYMTMNYVCQYCTFVVVANYRPVTGILHYKIYLSCYFVWLIKQLLKNTLFFFFLIDNFKGLLVHDGQG